MNYRSVRRASSAFALALLCLFPAIGVANAQQCMAGYYRAKSPACIDQVLAQFRQMPNPRSEPSTIIGFLAQIFRGSAQEREHILKAESTDYVKSVMLLSLYRAGLPDDAQKFATANNLSAQSEKLRGMHLIALDAVKPSSVPGDNDLLIGAYRASGNTSLIQRILENYSSADDAMAADGFRIGLMMSKFAPKGRPAVTVQAACARYQCKEDQTKLLRVMTLATALWSLQSLSGQDDGVKKALSDFFARDARLKNLFATEQTAFGNYLTAIVAVIALKDDHTGPDREQAYAAMDKSASIYENLGSAKDAFAPMMNLKK
ncbi:MAG: hypothetical protein QOD09_4037 [Bradyrhizobium sp.]|nr:hypothetical protein [Bradyrhizobium sp.]MEA2951761.1 hypothetical protein [Alphaproteobacteria bacterium]